MWRFSVVTVADRDRGACRPILHAQRRNSDPSETNIGTVCLRGGGGGSASTAIASSRFLRSRRSRPCLTARARRYGLPSTRAVRLPSSPACGRAGRRCARSRKARRQAIYSGPCQTKSGPIARAVRLARQDGISDGGTGDYDQLHHFVSDGVWDEAPLELELANQADKLVGGADAVLVVDDTTLPKKGTHSVGAAPPLLWARRPIARRWCR